MAAAGTACLLAAGGLVLLASSSSGTPAPATFILVCQTPPVLVDGIETSSQVATRVPEGTPIPAGCHRA